MKIVIIGGGPGGYSAAIRASQLGADVTIIEKKNIGGVCLNEGCMPTKVLLHSAESYSSIKEFSSIGIDIEGSVNLNWSKVQSHKEEIVKMIVGSIATLLKVNKVKIIYGNATVTSSTTVNVKGKDGENETVEFDKLLISTGSRPFIPNIPGIESQNILDSTQILAVKQIPESLIIIGGGVIGIEFAEIFRAVGTKVTIIEMLPQILSNFDQDISDVVRKKLIKNGVDIKLGCKVTRFEDVDNRITVTYEENESTKSAESSLVLLSIGRKPNTEEIGLENIGVQTDRGFITIDEDMATTADNVYAIGDCTGKNMLAHVAAEQGIVAVERIFGLNSEIRYDCIPSGVFCSPEISSVGLTENEAKNRGIDYKVAKFPLYANGKSLIDGGTEGLIKIVAESEYNQIIGAQIAGPRATDLISELAIALNMEATAEQIIATIHPHPTISESVKEAAVNLVGRSIYSY